MQVVEQISDGLLEPIKGFVSDGVVGIAGAIAGPFNIAVTLYVMTFGVMILLGYVRLPVSDFVVNVFKICFIATLISSTGVYNNFVTDIFFAELPTELGKILVAAGGGSVNPAELSSGTPFDQVLTECYNILNDIWEDSSWDEVGLQVMIALAMLVTVTAALLMFFVVMYAQITLGLILVLGPLFVGLALFRQTISFTSSYFGALFNFTILQILVFALLGLLIGFMNDFLADASSASGGEKMLAVLQLCGVFILSAFAALQLPGVASALAGSGFSIGGQLIGAAMGVAGRGAAAASIGTTRGIGNAAGRSLEAQREGLRGRASGGSVSRR